MGSVRKKGNNWYYTIEMAPVDGKRKRVERVAKGAKTKKEATRIMLEVENELKFGINTLDKSKMSYGDFLRYWMDSYVTKNLAKNTIDSYEHHLKRIIPALGHYELRQLTPMIIQDFIDKSLESFSVSTVDVYKAMLSGSLKYAVHPCGFIKSNPAGYVKVKRRKDDVDVKNKNTDFISLEKFEKILEVFEKDFTVQVFLKIAYNTGMRRGELLGLQWSDVDLDNKVIHVVNNAIRLPATEGHLMLSNPKNAASIRDISILDSDVKLLKELKKRQVLDRFALGNMYDVNDFVFKKENGDFYNFSTIAAITKKIKKNVDNNFHIHQLRHTHATMLVESEVSIKAAMMRLGHSNVDTTLNIYTSNTKPLQDESSTKFESYLNKISAK